jgi:endonuclease/exonuclease/phosphatase (EEP) superfamily protein YafD
MAHQDNLNRASGRRMRVYYSAMIWIMGICRFMVHRFNSAALCLLLVGCAGHNHGKHGEQGVMETSGRPAVMASESCEHVLDNVVADEGRRLTPDSIQLLNWNAHKHMHADMHEDLIQLSAGTDLILLQETAPDYDHLAQIDPPLHWVYAPGYNWAGRTTGVITASKIEPLAYCRIMSREPWLRSPKAINVTRYALLGTDETLLVFNVHLINFTLGVKALRQQLEAVAGLIRQHTRPVIVSGDFNTWSKKRAQVVASNMEELGLSSVDYLKDQRTRIFGRPVDHLFVRGIKNAQATTIVVESSDHNPMSVQLSLL